MDTKSPQHLEQITPLLATFPDALLQSHIEIHYQ